MNSVSLDPATGLLLVEGTATCSGPTTGYIFGDITQKRAGGEIRAFFGVDVVCGDTGTWRAISGTPRVVRGGRSSASAEFRRGTAVVSRDHGCGTKPPARSARRRRSVEFACIDCDGEYKEGRITQCGCPFSLVVNRSSESRGRIELNH